ncbi:hypothetical protein AX14_014186 [Amanita brunnescens Koide BX004]|nr:hypothetical protein AX14_014186 [Amanita brunnescens Koide BX004]
MSAGFLAISSLTTTSSSASFLATCAFIARQCPFATCLSHLLLLKSATYSKTSELAQRLEQKWQDIVTGRNAVYSEQLVQRTMTKFYGQFQYDFFNRPMKENRNRRAYSNVLRYAHS